MQYSTEFLKGGKGRKGAYASAVHQGGYETENVISPDGRNDVFKFGSTYDSGFENSDVMHEMNNTGGHAKAKKKKYTYMTLKTNQDYKSRSVSSNLGRMDHTCFI